MGKLTVHWFSYSLILVWLLICIMCQKVDMISPFANKGLNFIGNEYYRFVTTLLLHKNMIHVLSNAVALYFVGCYLEPQINPAKLFTFSVLIGMITEAVFSSIYRDSMSVGGSPIVFALIGLIIALQITKADAFKFQLGAWYSNWILGYAILANIPFFSNNFISTLIIHGIPVALGIVLGCLGVVLRIL